MQAVRRAAEYIFRNRALRRRLWLGKTSVPFYVSPDAQLKYLKPGRHSFDRDLIAIAETFLTPGMNVWDVGANVGVFTFASAACVGQAAVVAIEADIWLAGLLRKSRALTENSAKDIRILPVAVAAANGIESFKISPRGRASSTLARAARSAEIPQAREMQYVPALTMDTILETMPPPSFIKMDVEGAELMALQGAARLLSQVRPMFYMEVLANIYGDVAALFQANGYRIFDSLGVETQSAKEGNYFFIPSELSEGLHKLAQYKTALAA